MSTRKALVALVVAGAVVLATGGGTVHARVPQSTGASSAEPPYLGGEITISKLGNEEHLPSVAYNWKRDEYLVVWHTSGMIGGRDVLGARISNQGKVLATFTIHENTGASTISIVKDGAQPSVAYDPSNNQYLVVWTLDAFGDGSNWDIYGRFIPSSGPSSSFSAFPICTWGSKQWNPQVVHNDHPAWGEFLVVWWNETGAAVPAYVSGRRVYDSDTGGGFPGGGFTIASDTTDHFLNPDVAYNLARNEYLVVYDRNSSDIWATRLSASGGALGGGKFAIAGWPDAEQFPSVAACPWANHYLVVWRSHQSGGYYDVYGRFVQGDGTFASGSVRHIRAVAGAEVELDVAANARADQYLVVWQQQYSSLTGPYGIWGRLISADKTMGPELTIMNVWTPSDRTRPAVAGGETNYLVAWEHERYGTSYQDIHGRLVTPHAVFLPLVMRKF